jgi:hypothetical protein
MRKLLLWFTLVVCLYWVALAYHWQTGHPRLDSALDIYEWIGFFLAVVWMLVAAGTFLRRALD